MVGMVLPTTPRILSPIECFLPGHYLPWDLEVYMYPWKSEHYWTLGSSGGQTVEKIISPVGKDHQDLLYQEYFHLSYIFFRIKVFYGFVCVSCLKSYHYQNWGSYEDQKVKKIISPEGYNYNLLYQDCFYLGYAICFRLLIT